MDRATQELAYGIAAPGYRLPAATRVGRVKLQISDLAQSVAYYESVLGLQVVERTGDVALLAPAGGGDAIVELREKKGIRPASHRGLLGLYHFAILLPDRAALGRFLGHLMDNDWQAGMSDHLVSEAIYLQDPDNLGIEVYADRPRDTWRHSERELQMSTMPLDVRSVLAAAHGEQWTGAPAGTTVGHIHLHVGDLEQAESFYHRALGLDKVVWSYPGALFFSAGGYHHHLGTNTWARGAPSASENDAHLIEWELVVPTQSDVEQLADSVESAGHAARREDGALIVRDPWGTQLRFVNSR
ncbi:MAG TPA: VOC family protein [Gemmatimonadaceae bacterium]|nr:VOC family protein [Gemmatimonadaceae bacterium]